MDKGTEVKVNSAIAEIKVSLSKVEDLGGDDTQMEVDVIRGLVEELEERVKYVVAGKPEEEGGYCE